MARVLVRQAARSAASLETLFAKLAEQVAPGPARDAFLSRCRAQSESAGATALTRARPAEVESWAIPAAGAPGPTVLEGAAPGAGDLMVVEAELARRIGPLAPVLVRRAARGATSRADLVARLEDQIPDEAGRRAFRRAVLGHD